MKQLPLTLLVLSLFAGCGKSSDEPSQAAPSKAEISNGKATEVADTANEAPTAKKIVACDQRNFVSEGARQMAESLGKTAKPARVCMDYSNKTENGFGSNSCAQGTALETPCPTDSVVAKCTLSSGAIYYHYDGANLSTAERMCKTMEGTYETSTSD